MDDEQSLQSLPPEHQTADEDAAVTVAAPETPEPEAQVASAEAEAKAEVEAETEAKSETEAEPEAEAQRESGEENGLPHGSISAVGERLGQRVAQVSETAGDKMAHAGEVVGERVAHVGEAAGQKVILASEAAEGTVAGAQTRAVQAKQRIVEQVGHLGRRIRTSTPAPVREKGARAVDVVRKNPRKVFAAPAVVGLVAAMRRLGRRSGGNSGGGSAGSGSNGSE